MKRILVLQANPNKQSFISSLAEEYAKSARDAGHKVDLYHLVDISFDYNLTPGKRMETTLKRQQRLIKEADTVAIFSPVWWMGYPAVLKAYIDRVFTAGFAFKYPHPNPLLKPFAPEPLLVGKVARLVMTQDSPRPVLLLLGSPFRRSQRIALFRFVGFSLKKKTFSAVRTASPKKRKKWTKQVQRLGKNGE